MAKFELIMPKLGESVQEATIIQWFKKEGDKVEEDDPVLEIATDKVDSEIPSPVEGIIEKILFKTNDVVPVGEIIAIVKMGEETGTGEKKTGEVKVPEQPVDDVKETPQEKTVLSGGTRFYSPLVKSIASRENISMDELEKISGSGSNGRVRKQDVFTYIENRKTGKTGQKQTSPITEKPKTTVNVTASQGDVIVEMDRMRRLIADHMVMSKQVSPHVSNFIEVDVTALSMWRDKVKDKLLSKENVKLTFMPMFIEATAAALKEYPGVNASVDGYNIIQRKNVNIGIAVALKTGNLIVPVIKNADQKNLLGIALELNRVAENARSNKLSPDDIQDGTFTISNFGSFKNLTGTPIINQPQVAILATGTVEKKPAVLETPSGDVIAIRHKMILSLSYDHRVVDGALAGAFLYRLKQLLENFDMERTI